MHALCGGQFFSDVWLPSNPAATELQVRLQANGIARALKFAPQRM